MTDLTVDPPEQEETMTGLVERRVVGVGSKSEMSAVGLGPDAPASAGDAEGVVLRRRDAVALDAEPELLAYVGRHVRVVGRRGWSVFVVDVVEALDDERGDAGSPSEHGEPPLT